MFKRYEVSLRQHIVARRPDVFETCDARTRRRFIMLGQLDDGEDTDMAAEMKLIMSQANEFGSPVEAAGFMLQEIPHANLHDDAIEVPWLGSMYQALPGGFLRYPESMGYDLTSLRKGIFDDGDDARGIAFLQSWLFFGLIREMLGDDAEISYDHWIDLDEPGASYRRLISPFLPHYLHLFSATLQADRSNEKLHYWTDLLELTFTIVEVFDQRFANTSTPQRHDALRVTWSILIFGQMLSNIVLRMYKIESANIEQWPDGTLLDERLESRNWCPCLINRLKITLSMDSLYYLTMLNWDAPEQLYAPPSRRDHAHCTMYQCQADQVDYDIYHTLHTHEGCKCISVGPEDLSELYNILDDGIIPVVIISKSSDGHSVSIKLERRANVPEYVAISHVWADGLGNPDGNSLPACQLFRIARYLEELTGGAQHAFWIDTICVPRDVMHRWKALDLMNQTYAQASRVLVLDASLVKSDAYSVLDQELVDSDLRLAETWRMGIALETMTRIVCSSWTTRLWTLPEGQMSPLLYFRFLDTALELSDLYIQLELWPWAGTSLVHDLRRFLIRLRPRLRTQEARGIRSVEADMLVWPTSAPRDRFIAMMHAIEWRDTSRRSDEVLCLSIQLNLDVPRIMSAPVAERMPAMFREIATIPQDLIFSRGPRIQQEGFRWAPDSLLEVRKHFSMIPASKPDTSFGLQRDQGLLLNIECIQFHPGDLPSSEELFFSALSPSDQQHMAEDMGSAIELDKHAPYKYFALLVDVEDPKHLSGWQDDDVIQKMLQAGADIAAIFLLLGREGLHGPPADQKPGRVGLLTAAMSEGPEADGRVRVQPLLSVLMYEVPPKAERPDFMPGGGGVPLWHGWELGKKAFCIV